MSEGSFDGPPATFTIVQNTFLAAGRPRVSISKPLPGATSEQAALSAARALASGNPSRRYRLMRLDPRTELPQVIWDSHPSS
jgi:hypothetical protein